MTLIDGSYENMFFKLALIKLFSYINKIVAIPLVYPKQKHFSRCKSQAQ